MEEKMKDLDKMKNLEKKLKAILEKKLVIGFFTTLPSSQHCLLHAQAFYHVPSPNSISKKATTVRR
jgi:adenine C2-methylase RlmN of 23S rRNA A2503 and tRNA A37